MWRFDRLIGDAKLLAISNVEVAMDIYTVFGDDGTPDTVIEDDILCDVEGTFCATRDLLRDRTPVAREDWANLARFIAVQLLRTPRVLQLMCDEMDARDIEYGRDTPQRVMAILMQRWVLRIARMRGIIAYNETDFPFMTSDNPAVTWKNCGEGFECGLGSARPRPRHILPIDARADVRGLSDAGIFEGRNR